MIPQARPVRRTRLTTVAAVTTTAALTLVLAACGGSGGDADGAATTEGGAATSAPAGPLEGEISFAWWGDTTRADRYQEAIELFEADNPDVSVLTQFAAWGDYWTSRNTEAAGSSLPDVFQMDLAYLAEYAGNGRLLALDDQLGSAIDVGTIAETLLPSGQVDGTTYAIPTSSSTLATILNVDLLAELGVAVPEAGVTWSEYDAFLAEVSAAGAGLSPAVFGSLDYTQVFWLFSIWLEQQGLTLIDDDGALGFTQDDLVTWWSRSQTLQSDASVMPMDRQFQLEGDAIGLREVGADVSWSNFLIRYSEGTGGDELAMIPVPSDDPGDPGLFLKPGLMLSTSATTEHADIAAAFTDFLTNDPRVGEIFGMSRGVPASSKALAGVADEGLDAQIKAFSEKIAPLVTHESPTSVRGFSTLESTFTALAQDVAYGTLTPEDAASEWFAEAESALG